jgi:hypothetical protein
VVPSIPMLLECLDGLMTGGRGKACWQGVDVAGHAVN